MASAQIQDYPRDHHHFGKGIGFAIGLHLSVMLLVLLIAYIFGIRSLAQLMLQGGSIALSGPAPEELEITLEPEPPPPPPTLNPEFIRQVTPPKPPDPPKVKPIVKPKVKPAYTAPHATGQGKSNAVSKAVVGTSGFPKPPYPYQARSGRIEGTTLLSIQFDSNGNAADVTLVSSSGSALLDISAITFIRENWHNPSVAGQKQEIPISYQLEGSVSH